jgi:hypothetical protein
MAIATGSGSVMKEFDFMAIKVTPKASTAITKGEVLVNQNGNGWEPSFNGAHGPFMVALEDVASAASPSDVSMLRRGVVKLTAQADTKEGEFVKPGSNSGEVTPLTTFGTADLKGIVGSALEDVDATECGKFLIGY